MANPLSGMVARSLGLVTIASALTLPLAGVGLAEQPTPPPPPPSVGSTGTKGGVYGDGSKVYRGISCPLAYELYYKDEYPHMSC